MFSDVYNTLLEEYTVNSLVINSYMTHSACMECVFDRPDCVKLKNVRTKCYCAKLW